MIYGTDEFDQLLKDIIREGYRHDSYECETEHAEEMSWHLYGVKPIELLERSRPREDPEVTKYRIENYEPTTKSSADKAVHIVSKIFNPNLSSIRWNEKNKSAQTDELKKYTLEEYPKNGSVVNFMKDVLLRKMLADPNSVCVAKLAKIPNSQTDRPMPVLKIFGAPTLFYTDEDCYLFNIKIKDEKYYYFEYYDKTQYVQFMAYISADNKTLNIEESENYAYNFTEIPAWRLQGMQDVQDDGTVVYKSFFSSALPYWNLAVIHESDLYGAYINHLHPIRVELSEQCDYKFKSIPCRAGKINLEDGPIDCPGCKGSGYKSVVSPYGTYKYNKEKLDDFQGTFQPVDFVTVPVDATKMLEERVQTVKDKAMGAINMDIEEKIGENQSGVAKTIDRSAQYDTLYNIGSVIYDVHLQNTFYFFNLFMFGEEAKAKSKDAELNTNLPEISKPTKFDISSVDEMISNYAAANEGGINRTFLQLKQIEIVSKDLTTNTDLKDYTATLLDLDPLPGMPFDEVTNNVAKGFNSKNDAIIHFNIKTFMDRALSENDNFYELDKTDKLAILNNYADEFVKANKPVIDITMLNPNQNGQSKKGFQAQAPNAG